MDGYWLAFESFENTSRLHAPRLPGGATTSRLANSWMLIVIRNISVNLSENTVRKRHGFSGASSGSPYDEHTV
ncbi:hypothetical protein CC2G_001347 [Coprinopsis cinerea AmutBmut pab1-1]|nr:hypothetical protein CC2G_001347 [Coprinopsis cinerea AmutBmut pab1-1]